ASWLYKIKCAPEIIGNSSTPNPRRCFESNLGRRRVDDRFDFRDAVRRKSALLRVFADQCLAGRVVNAIDLVGGDVAVDPLNLRAEVLEHPAGFLRDGLESLGRHIARAGDFAFNHVLRHGEVLLAIQNGKTVYRTGDTTGRKKLASRPVR